MIYFVFFDIFYYCVFCATTLNWGVRVATTPTTFVHITLNERCRMKTLTFYRYLAVLPGPYSCRCINFILIIYVLYLLLHWKQMVFLFVHYHFLEYASDVKPIALSFYSIVIDFIDFFMLLFAVFADFLEKIDCTWKFCFIISIQFNKMANFLDHFSFCFTELLLHYLNFLLIFIG